jgi:hypothetical protein
MRLGREVWPTRFPGTMSGFRLSGARPTVACSETGAVGSGPRRRSAAAGVVG